MMKKMGKFDIFVNLWISLVINVVLSIVLPLVAIGMLTPAIFLKGFAIAFTVSTAFVFLVPVVSLGQKFASLFKVKPQASLPSCFNHSAGTDFGNPHELAYDGC
jgi:hypothetical protein